MPLDPYFAERLATHRRYLFAQARSRAIRRVRDVLPWGSARHGAPTRAPKGTALDRQRKAALAWDAKELAAIGLAGPLVLTAEHIVSADPDVRVRVYYPGGELPDTPVPVVVSFFGSGFRIGGIDFPTTDAEFRRRAQDSSVAVVAVDYALAPEHRYPTPVRQGMAVLDWVVSDGSAHGLDSSRLALAGISSGANIAAAVALTNRDGAAHPILLQVLEVPVLDLTGGHIDMTPMRELRIPRPLAAREMRIIASDYLKDRSRAAEALASPLLASSLTGLPRTVILTAEYDPLRGDGESYNSALRDAGVDSSGVRYLGVTHDAHMFVGVLGAARRWHDDVVTAYRSLAASDRLAP